MNMQIRPASHRVVKFVQNKSKTSEYPTTRGFIDAAAIFAIAYGSGQLGSFWTGLTITGAATAAIGFSHGVVGAARNEFKDLGGRAASYIKSDGGATYDLAGYVANHPELLKSYVNSDDVYIKELHTAFALSKKAATSVPKSADLSGPHDGLRLHSIFRVGAKEGGNVKSYILQTWVPLQNKSQIESAVRVEVESAQLTGEFGSEGTPVDVTAAYKNAPLTIDQEVLEEYRGKAFDSLVNQTEAAPAHNANGKWDFSA